MVTVPQVASLVVACLALLFTIASFWWLQARRGRLACFPVQEFAGYLDADRVTVRIPLSIYNHGAAARVVTQLRLRLRPQEGDSVVLHALTFRRTLKPMSDDVEDFVHPYAVSGRTVASRHVEFSSLAGVGPSAALLSGHPVTVVVEALIDQDDERWTELGHFPLHVEAMAHVGTYLACSNHPRQWPENLLDEAAQAFAALRERMGLPQA